MRGNGPVPDVKKRAARETAATAGVAQLARTAEWIGRQDRRREAGRSIQPLQTDPAHGGESATLSLRANLYGGTLNLACLPTFAARWLTPRLPGFMAAHPTIRLNLLTRTTRFEFDSDPFDAAIHFGEREWPGAELMLLRHESSIPVASPEFAAHHDLGGPASLVDVPLLHLASRPDAWERWFAKANVAVENLRGMLFDQFSTLSEAAIASLGVALLPEFLIEKELQDGRLTRITGLAMETDGAYYLAWPKERSAYEPLRAFRTWIRAEAA